MIMVIKHNKYLMNTTVVTRVVLKYDYYSLCISVNSGVVISTIHNTGSCAIFFFLVAQFTSCYYHTVVTLLQDAFVMYLDNKHDIIPKKKDLFWFLQRSMPISIKKLFIWISVIFCSETDWPWLFQSDASLVERL